MKHERDLQSRANIDTGDEVLYRDTPTGVMNHKR